MPEPGGRSNTPLSFGRRLFSPMLPVLSFIEMTRSSCRVADGGLAPLLQAFQEVGLPVSDRAPAARMANGKTTVRGPPPNGRDFDPQHLGRLPGGEQAVQKLMFDLHNITGPFLGSRRTIHAHSRDVRDGHRAG